MLPAVRPLVLATLHKGHLQLQTPNPKPSALPEAEPAATPRLAALGLEKCWQSARRGLRAAAHAVLGDPHMQSLSKVVSAGSSTLVAWSCLLCASCAYMSCVAGAALPELSENVN